MWIDEFRKLMAESTVTPGSIHNAHELKDKNLPSKIYKFRKINNYAISNFKDDTVWFCSADKYNDPYECTATCNIEEVARQFTKFNIDKIFDQTDLEKHLSVIEINTIKTSSDPMRELSKLLIGKHEGIPDGEKEKIISELSTLERDLLQQIFIRWNQFAQAGMKICSFSSRVDSTVMWGHYADSHKGFAIEYDITNWPLGDIRRRKLYPVIYRQELFDSTQYHLQIASGENRNNLFGIIAAIHKSFDWSYENEWRFVLPMSKSSPDKNYSMPKPSAVYAGSRIKPRNLVRLSRIAADKKIPIYQMRLSTSEFKLTPHQVTVV